MDLGIKGKWALVCGASKGLGFGCAQALVREGVHVIIVARGAEALQAAAAQLMADPLRPATTEVLSVAADITSTEGRAAVFKLRQDFDIVITNAGGPPPGDFRQWDRDTWIKAVDANMLTPIELIKATVDGMAARGFGRIINITSSAVKAPIDVLGLSNGARSLAPPPHRCPQLANRVPAVRATRSRTWAACSPRDNAPPPGAHRASSRSTPPCFASPRRGCQSAQPVRACRPATAAAGRSGAPSGR